MIRHNPLLSQPAMAGNRAVPHLALPLRRPPPRALATNLRHRPPLHDCRRQKRQPQNIAHVRPVDRLGAINVGDLRSQPPFKNVTPTGKCEASARYSSAVRVSVPTSSRVIGPCGRTASTSPSNGTFLPIGMEHTAAAAAVISLAVISLIVLPVGSGGLLDMCSPLLPQRFGSFIIQAEPPTVRPALR